MEEIYYGNMFQIVFNGDVLVPKTGATMRSSIVNSIKPREEMVTASTNIGGFDVIVEDEEEVVETINDPVTASYIPSQIPRRIKEAPNVTVYSGKTGGCGCNKR